MAPKVTEEYRNIVRDKILQSAAALFSRNGYHTTSMDDIVKESGLSKGAIYGYFKSKDDLFLALSDKQIESMIDCMQDVFSPNDSAKKKLMKAAEIHFRQITYLNDIWRVALELWAESPKIPSLEIRVRKHYDIVHKFFADIIYEGKKNEEFRKDIDPDMLSSILLATLGGLSIHTRMGQKFDWQKIKKSLFALLYEGIIEEESEDKQ